MERQEDRDDKPTPAPGDALPSGDTDEAEKAPSPLERPPAEDVPPVEERD